jgi:hypothetical protein
MLVKWCNSLYSCGKTAVRGCKNNVCNYIIDYYQSCVISSRTYLCPFSHFARPRSSVSVPIHSRDILSKVGLQVDQHSKQNYFPIVPQVQCMTNNFLALSLYFFQSKKAPFQMLLHKTESSWSVTNLQIIKDVGVSPIALEGVVFTYIYYVNYALVLLLLTQFLFGTTF